MVFLILDQTGRDINNFSTFYLSTNLLPHDKL